MKKKITALFLSIVMVLSIMTVAFAQKETTEDSEEVTDAAVEAEVEDTTNIDECVEKAKQRFPRAKEARINRICQRVITKTEEVKEAVTIRVNETAFGQKVRDCMQELLKKQPNLIRSEVAKKCVLEKKAAGELVIAQKLRVQERLDQCEDEACKEKHQARINKIDALTEAAKNRLTKIEEKRLERIKEIKKFELKSKIKVAKNFKAREIIKLKLTESRARYAQAKVKFAETKEKLKVSKVKFAAAVKLKKACGVDAESKECLQAQEEIFTASKDHLLKVVEVITNHLEKVKEHIESNEYLEEEAAQDAISKIETDIATLETLKAEIEAAQTKEELKEATTKLKEEWSKIKVIGESFAGKSVNARIGGIIVKSKYLEIKLEKILSRMEENGIDTTTVSGLIDSLHNHIEEAKTKHEGSVTKYNEAKETRSKEALEEAKTLMTESRQHLKDADKGLKEIFATLKIQAGEILSDETIDEEVEEEVETAEETEEEE